MKKAFWISAALLFALPSCRVCELPNIASVEKFSDKPILDVIWQQEEAWNRGDIEGYMQGYAKSSATTFASGDKMTRGWQETLERYQKGYDSREKMGRLEFADLNVEMISHDAAIVTGHWALVREKDNPQGLFTLLFRKFPEGWRIVHDHTSAAKS